jgi:hypothetical protein
MRRDGRNRSRRGYDSGGGKGCRGRRRGCRRGWRAWHGRRVAPRPASCFGRGDWRLAPFRSECRRLSSCRRRKRLSSLHKLSRGLRSPNQQKDSKKRHVQEEQGNSASRHGESRMVGRDSVIAVRHWGRWRHWRHNGVVIPCLSDTVHVPPVFQSKRFTSTHQFACLTPADT